LLFFVSAWGQQTTWVSKITLVTSKTAATVNWTTPIPASSVVNWGTSTSYGHVASSTNMVTTHAVTISGLTPNTVYYFRLLSYDAANFPVYRTGRFTTVATAPILSVSPGGLNFSYTVGGTSPAAQSLTLTSSGSALTYSASSSASWLLAAGTGTTPSSLSIKVNPTGLAAGTYSGSITVKAPNASNPSVTVPVAMTISAQAKQYQVLLNWNPSSTSGATYNVYRGTSSGGPYTRIGNTSQVTYGDGTVLSGSAYYYVVTAVDANGESGYSNETQAVVP
jgi:predicted secreted protein